MRNSPKPKQAVLADKLDDVRNFAETNNASLTEMSAKYGVSRDTVRSFCIANDIEFRKGPKIRDLTGMRFGHLVVIRISSRENHLRWTCECDCGRTSDTPSTANLIYGRTTCCGIGCRYRAYTDIHHVSRTGETQRPDANVECTCNPWPDGRHRCGCARRTRGKEGAPFFRKKIAKLEAEIERLNAILSTTGALS